MALANLCDLKLTVLHIHSFHYLFNQTNIFRHSFLLFQVSHSYLTSLRNLLVSSACQTCVAMATARQVMVEEEGRTEREDTGTYIDEEQVTNLLLMLSNNISARSRNLWSTFLLRLTTWSAVARRLIIPCWRTTGGSARSSWGSSSPGNPPPDLTSTSAVLLSSCPACAPCPGQPSYQGELSPAWCLITWLERGLVYRHQTWLTDWCCNSLQQTNLNQPKQTQSKQTKSN